EESAGASFLRRDGSVWTTDKDGIILALLASEILAVTGRSPSTLHAELVEEFGSSAYARMDAPADREQKAKLKALSGDQVSATELAGEPIVSAITEAPAGGAIGGLKVSTASAWFAARPSGTEDIYKIYAESFKGAEHLGRVQDAAKALGDEALADGRRSPRPPDAAPRVRRPVRAGAAHLCPFPQVFGQIQVKHGSTSRRTRGRGATHRVLAPPVLREKHGSKAKFP